MKTRRVLPLLLILAILASASYIFLSRSSFTLTIGSTQNLYQVNEDINLYGNLTYNGVPLSYNLIAIEVKNPNGDPVVVRSAQTDMDGAFNLTFKLFSDAKLGTYTVYVSSEYMGEKTFNSTTFFVTIAGDIDSDVDVDVHDLYFFARAYNSRTGEPSYIEAADLDNDGDIDSQDLSLFAEQFGRS
jgi:hypothetical protein